MASGQIVGRDAFVSIEFSGSTFNVSGDGNRAVLNQPVETPEKTTFQPLGGTRQRSASGLRDWNFSFDGFFDDALFSGGSAAAGVEDVVRLTNGNQVVLQFGPAGSTSGYRSYTGSGIVQNPAVESPVDGMITISLEIVASTGSLTTSTFA